tara:strand:+ start:767 stop:1630 length:864 start_codon:yes stop_codon:yes gene_type:complete
MMGLKEFFFSYKTILKFFYNEKKYFKICRKFFGYPYKYFLDLIRSFFLINKINLDKIKSEKFKKYSLDQLFIFFNSDKGSRFDNWGNIIKGHNYSTLYEHHFSKFRFKKKVKILEIGSLFGSSAASFLKYFHNAEIYCLDVNPFQIKYISKNMKKIYFNSANRKTVSDISNYFDCEFDIIIDDGSHNKKDQIVTLNYFLPKIKNKGLYVVEDTCEYIKLPKLNDDKLDYGVNEFVQSVFETGRHFSKYLTDLEKKNIKNMINKLYLEKGNFIHNNESLPEIIFIEKK